MTWLVGFAVAFLLAGAAELLTLVVHRFVLRDPVEPGPPTDTARPLWLRLNHPVTTGDVHHGWWFGAVCTAVGGGLVLALLTQDAL